MVLPWVSLLQGIGAIADNLITTEEEKLKLQLQEKAMDVSLLQGQIDTNKIEAAHSSTFVAGWRPAAGWVSALALFMAFVPKAVVQTGIWSYQAIIIISQWHGIGTPPIIPVFPDLGVTDLIGLLMAMLGLGGYRTFEKIRGTSRETLE